MKPLNNRVYDVLKWFALLVLPTLAGALVAIGEIWSTPVDQDIIATINGLSTAVGTILTVSSMLYYSKITVNIPSMPVKVYKVLQDMTLYWLPTFATIYYILSWFVHVHYVVPVVETAIVIQVFLGLILGTYSTQTGDLRYWFKKNLEEILAKAGDILGRRSNL